MSMIDDIKRDREGLPEGSWFSLPMQGPRGQTNFARVFATDDDLRYIADCRDTMNFHSKTDNEANARRIARVPDMEAALIIAEGLAQAYAQYASRPAADNPDDWQAMQTAYAAFRAATGAA